MRDVEYDNKVNAQIRREMGMALMPGQERLLLTHEPDDLNAALKAVTDALEELTLFFGTAMHHDTLLRARAVLERAGV